MSGHDNVNAQPASPEANTAKPVAPSDDQGSLAVGNQPGPGQGPQNLESTKLQTQAMVNGGQLPDLQLHMGDGQNAAPGAAPIDGAAGANPASDTTAHAGSAPSDATVKGASTPTDTTSQPGSIDPGTSIEDYVAKIKATTPAMAPGDTPRTDGSPDLAHLSDDDVTKYFESNPPTKSDPDYTKLMGDDKVMLLGDVTHGAMDPGLLGKIADQMKNANPPIKTVGLEMFSSAWDSDFKGYAKNPDATVTDPKTGQPETDATGQPVTYRDKVLSHVEAIAGVATSPDQAKSWVDGMMDSLDKINQDGMTVKGLEPPAPHIYDDNGGYPKGWAFPSQGLTSLLQDTSYKSEGGETTAQMLKDYTSADATTSASARAKLQDYFTSHPSFMTGSDGQPLANPNPAKTASDLMETMDAMKGTGFFDTGIPMVTNGQKGTGSSDNAKPMETNSQVDQDQLALNVNSWRSKVMGDEIADTVKDGSRMIASMGSAHLGYNPNGITTVSEVLKDKGLDSVSLGFAGKDYFDLQTDHYEGLKKADALNPTAYAKDDAGERGALAAGTWSDANEYDFTSVRLSDAAKRAGVSDFTLPLTGSTRPFDYFVSPAP